ncbi:endonuclease V [Sphingomonas fennica]|uniref:Endonuclease V n=1 Tax=Edaphosphingomonas fennica TaxID=114404 RepID=A0A2T4I6N7_9SPHN|nr:endonuclease V [Sphingomonas fennica]AGH48268.1 endonuclease V [Sphingomonas sp. MM-1]PTD26225.1 endonuclease V [Sphingomonas fennica]
MSRDWLSVATLKEATIVQRMIGERIETADRLPPAPRVAGADVSMKWRDSMGPVHAAIAPVDGPAATATAIPPFPYVPGYLGFREVPVLAMAWDRMAASGGPVPDLLIVDGHGRAHPRRAGVASHLGVALDVPTIGCAKTLLCGVVEGEVGPDPGDRAPVVHGGEVVAMALRMRARAAPVYVGIGHRVSLETAVDWVLRLGGGRRLPLPVRLAHDAANAARRLAEAERS